MDARSVAQARVFGWALWIGANHPSGMQSRRRLNLVVDKHNEPVLLSAVND